MHALGAVLAAGAYVVPSWKVGLGPDSNVGGLIAAVLSPLGGFGKFLIVLLVLTIPSGTNPTLYTVCTSFMAISPSLAKVPRFVIALFAIAMYVNNFSFIMRKTHYHPIRSFDDAERFRCLSLVHQGSI